MMSPSQLPPRSPTKIAEYQKKVKEIKKKAQIKMDPNLMSACVCTRYGKLREVDVIHTSSNSSTATPSSKISNTNSMVSTSSNSTNATPIFEIQDDIPRPKIEDPHHVLIRNFRTTINPVDCKTRAGNLDLVTGHSKQKNTKRKPTKSSGKEDMAENDYDEDDERANFPLLILGQDFAGIVDAVGDEVKSFKAGDMVYGSTAPRSSCSAEYVCAFDYECALKPDQITWDEAAATPTAFCTAWKGLFDPQLGNLTIYPIDKDDGTAENKEEEETLPPTYVVDKDDEDERPPRVLVIGAAGSVGAAAVQLAKQIGKAEVAAICGSRNMDYVKSLGASPVFDYANAGYEIYYTDHENERFDIIFDCVGGDSYYYKLHQFLNKKDLPKHQKAASTAAVVCNRTNPSIYVTCVGPVMHGGSEKVTFGRIAQTAQTLVPRFVGNYMLPGRWNSRYAMFLSFTTQNGVLDQITKALATRKILPRIDPISPLPMEQLGRGHYQVERGHSNGKVVIAVQDK
ncbi:unnamed protein product [Cylindrotheca closterium]|uniref:Enoyl reductase (ER) domain-containing protein n=1 Tax=Cylindrotheca closterium TaxID=2856 RepID=A0AAD2FRU7_9STRA|nr:unnamed protein product [Cylindrotheca closterium]